MIFLGNPKFFLDHISLKLFRLRAMSYSCCEELSAYSTIRLTADKLTCIMITTDSLILSGVGKSIKDVNKGTSIRYIL